MTLSNDERELLERALDELFDLVSFHCEGEELVRATGLYCRGISIVRERPEGERKVRSDFMTQRPAKPGPQEELGL